MLFWGADYLSQLNPLSLSNQSKPNFMYYNLVSCINYCWLRAFFSDASKRRRQACEAWENPGNAWMPFFCSVRFISPSGPISQGRAAAELVNNCSRRKKRKIVLDEIRCSNSTTVQFYNIGNNNTMFLVGAQHPLFSLHTSNRYDGRCWRVSK